MKTSDEFSSSNTTLEDNSRLTVLSNLAYVVRKQRESLGLSIEDIAARTKLSVSELNAFELGEWDIDLLSLDKIADCLNVKLKVVFISTEALEAKGKKKRD